MVERGNDGEIAVNLASLATAFMYRLFNFLVARRHCGWRKKPGNE